MTMDTLNPQQIEIPPGASGWLACELALVAARSKNARQKASLMDTDPKEWDLYQIGLGVSPSNPSSETLTDAEVARLLDATLAQANEAASLVGDIMAPEVDPVNDTVVIEPILETQPDDDQVPPTTAGEAEPECPDQVAEPDDNPWPLDQLKFTMTEPNIERRVRAPRFLRGVLRLFSRRPTSPIRL